MKTANSVIFLLMMRRLTTDLVDRSKVTGYGSKLSYLITRSVFINLFNNMSNQFVLGFVIFAGVIMKLPVLQFEL